MTSIAIHTPARRNSVASDRSSSWRGVLQRHAYIIPSFAIVLLVCAWFMTWGDWRFFDREVFCGFYDAQARSILHGRLDVPPRAIGIEAFYFRGKTYGYFGIGPALLRIPLVLLSNNMDGRWSRGLMFIACFINLLCAYRILLWARGSERVQTGIDRTLNSLFILCAGIGSTNIFIVDRCYTYHEAIMWGATFALLFTVAIIYYFRSQDIRALAAAGVFAFFSFHSRPTGGAGALLVLGILAAIFTLRAVTGKPLGEKFLLLPAVDRPFRHALVAGMASVIIVAVYFGVNYGKFRTFDGVPVKYYGMYHTDPRRMVVTGGKQIHIENIPTGLASYFGMRGATFHASFPWIYMSRTPSVIGHPAIDVVEQYSSVPISMPALGLLALLGAMFVLRGPSDSIRHMRLPITGLMIGGGIILMTVGITERYVHDLYPFLIVAAAAGVARVAEGKNPRRLTRIIGVLAVISIVLNCTFALEYQRLAVWGVSETKRVEMQNVQHAVDRFFHVQPAAIAADD